MLETDELECLKRKLGDIIKLNRERQGLTQAELAERSKISVRTIIKIESDGGNPTLEILYPLVRALNIDPNDLFYPEREKENPDFQELRILLFQSEASFTTLLNKIAKTLKKFIKSRSLIDV